MATVESPITRSELREEPDKRLQHYATRADLSGLETLLVKWMVGQMIAAAVIASSVAVLLLRFVGLGGRGSSNG